MKLEELAEKIRGKFNYLQSCYVEGNEIVVEEEYYMDEDEKNSDGCVYQARETGEVIIEHFPELEISDYYCHRNKYSIVELKLKQ